MDDDFFAVNRYRKGALQGGKRNAIFDWHCHLSPKEIYDNKNPDDIAELWLSYDHYKWRAMRSFGIDEKYITGDADGYDKFKAWAKTMPYLIGNPLYHWTHLELQRYFGIYKTLSPETCDEIWEKCNVKIKKRRLFSARAYRKNRVLCASAQQTTRPIHLNTISFWLRIRAFHAACFRRSDRKRLSV